MAYCIDPRQAYEAEIMRRQRNEEMPWWLKHDEALRYGGLDMQGEGRLGGPAAAAAAAQLEALRVSANATVKEVVDAFWDRKLKADLRVLLCQ